MRKNVHEMNTDVPAGVGAHPLDTKPQVMGGYYKLQITLETK